MHDKRWDCSTLKYAPKFKRDLRKGTSERAFVHSLSSAAVGINVAKRCALGDLDKCGCNERPQDDHLDEKVIHFRWLKMTYPSKLKPIFRGFNLLPPIDTVVYDYYYAMV